MWWMLARIAGWDGGGTTTIPVTAITVTGVGGSTTIVSDNGTLQLTATVSPLNATNQTVTWSLINGTGQATISASGLVTGIANGTVTARAVANDASGISGTLAITISNQGLPVTGISVIGTGGSTTIATDNGTLQLTATVSPSYATNQTVTWSSINVTGQATISASGLVTAITDGTVMSRAIANDGSGIYGDFETTISNQVVNSQIIADHSVVDKFDDIPQYYIDQVKKMWLVVGGESPSQAYRTGLTLLESLNPAYSVSVKESGTPRIVYYIKSKS